jgi:hypothetical protein
VAERQTRTVQVRVLARVWGFKSPLAHHFDKGEKLLNLKAGTPIQDFLPLHWHIHEETVGTSSLHYNDIPTEFISILYLA